MFFTDFYNLGYKSWIFEILDYHIGYIPMKVFLFKFFVVLLLVHRRVNYGQFLEISYFPHRRFERRLTDHLLRLAILYFPHGQSEGNFFDFLLHLLLHRYYGNRTRPFLFERPGRNRLRLGRLVFHVKTEIQIGFEARGRVQVNAQAFHLIVEQFLLYFFVLVEFGIEGSFVQYLVVA